MYRHEWAEPTVPNPKLVEGSTEVLTVSPSPPEDKTLLLVCLLFLSRGTSVLPPSSRDKGPRPVTQKLRQEEKAPCLSKLEKGP